MGVTEYTKFWLEAWPTVDAITKQYSVLIRNENWAIASSLFLDRIINDIQQ